MTNSGDALLPIIILGAGGHGQVIADALLRHPATADIPLIFLDDDPATHNTQRLGFPVAGGIADLGAIPHRSVVIGIGNNRTRKMIAQSLEARGETFATVIHPQAVIAAGVEIGAGSVIFANAVVNTGSRVGKHVVLNTACTVDHHNQVGDFSHVAPGAHLGGDVIVGEGAFVGIGGIVMPQRQVGDWATVGAGALASRTVPPGVTIVGIPGRSLQKSASE